TAFPIAGRIDNHHHASVQLSQHHEARLSEAVPTRILPPHERSPKHDTRRFKDEIAFREGIAALFRIPIEIIIAIRRYPRSKHWRHSKLLDPPDTRRFGCAPVA